MVGQKIYGVCLRHVFCFDLEKVLFLLGQRNFSLFLERLFALEEVEDAHILFDRFGWLVLLELVGADKDERKYLYIHITHALKVTHDWTHVLLLSPDKHNPI